MDGFGCDILTGNETLTVVPAPNRLATWPEDFRAFPAASDSSIHPVVTWNGWRISRIRCDRLPVSEDIVRGVSGFGASHRYLTSVAMENTGG